jgi:nucleotide-binding universal stress UspA family protein
MSMRVVVWIAEGTWPACVDSARALVPGDAEIELLHVTPEDAAGAARGAYAGLLGRHYPGPDPSLRIEAAERASARELLAAAAERLGRPARQVQREGNVERAVVDAAAGADLLIAARDGDQQRLGPKSLGRASRFIVDHAPCPVLLVWPGPAPPVSSIPRPPHARPPHARPPHARP